MYNITDYENVKLEEKNEKKKESKSYRFYSKLIYKKHYNFIIFIRRLKGDKSIKYLWGD